MMSKGRAGGATGRTARKFWCLTLIKQNCKRTKTLYISSILSFTSRPEHASQPRWRSSVGVAVKNYKVSPAGCRRLFCDMDEASAPK